MDRNDLVAQACSNHLLFAKGFYKAIENFLTHSQSRVLLWLSQQEKPCAVDIIDHFGLSAGRVSNILKALEEKGYLFRKKSSEDRRNSYIELTEAGKVEAEQTLQNVQNLYEAFFEKLGPEDAKTFLELEEKIMVLFAEADDH